MNDEVLYELGVDLHSDMGFHDGDIILCKYDDNLVQAIANQLNTNLNELFLFYRDYGSVFTSFLGWRATDETLNYMKSEISTILNNENRVQDYEIDLKYTSNGNVKIELVLKPNMNYTINADLVLTNNGVEVI